MLRSRLKSLRNDAFCLLQVAEKDAVQGLWEEAESARKAAQTEGSDLRKCLEASKQAQEQLQIELDAQLQKSTTAECAPP